MSFTNGKGAKIYFETMGPADGKPVLLIQGYTAQMIGWRDGFCQHLAERGMRVIRFDNRDVGLSEKFGGPDDLDGGYGLNEMAADGLRVLDELDLPHAHVVGQSMGGMIAQVMADPAPERVSALSLIYTAPAIEQRFFVPNITDSRLSPPPVRLARADAIDNYVAQERMAQSTAYPFNETWIRELGALAFDRCYAPDGGSRQWRAMMRWTGDFADHARLAMPVSIIHGRADGLIKADAGIELGSRIRHAEMHIYPGMGHEVVEPLWSEFASIIERTTLRASRQQAG